MLNTMMEMQKSLQEKLGTNFAELTDDERAQFMRNHRGYLEDEIAEALYEMPNYKLWKDYSNMGPEAKDVAWQKVRMELIDAFHFFMNLLLCAGMTADEVFYMYKMKNKENFERQERGYTADVSYRDQPVEDVIGAVSDSSENFVSFTADENGQVHMSYDTDALTMGIVAKMSAHIFAEMLCDIDEETRREIYDILEGGTINE